LDRVDAFITKGFVVGSLFNKIPFDDVWLAEGAEELLLVESGLIVVAVFSKRGFVVDSLTKTGLNDESAVASIGAIVCSG
jgi:hypothetical protein